MTHYYSRYIPFPQILNTERLDRVTTNLIEGRIAILVDRSPTVLIVPINFFSFYQSPDDYNSRAYIGTFIRVIRLCSFLLAMTLPALYIAVSGFQFEILPEELVLAVRGTVYKLFLFFTDHSQYVILLHRRDMKWPEAKNSRSPWFWIKR
ncbi:spore germination protein [Peribacillus frigoritolerans]